jgi:hypothetical protein
MHKFISLFILLALSGPCIATAVGEPEQSRDYLNVNIDRVVIDSDELATASATLAASIDHLAIAIAQLSTADTDLSEAERQTLLSAVASAEMASQALTELARQLPLRGQQLGERLPQLVSDARKSMAELSVGLQSARDSIQMIAESLPQATENSKQLVNSVLDSALLRLSIFSFVLVGAVALALIGIMWFIYRQYLDPLARKLDELVGAPEHFDNMARHMKETSSNLLSLQADAARTPGPGSSST